MLKDVVACIILCGMAFPANAGDRPSAAKARILAALPKPDATPVASRSGIQPFMLPARTAQLQPVPKVIVLSDQVAPRTSDAVTLAAWGPGSTLPEVTARAGGNYAVYDVMRDQPRPRHRGSPFSTALVLRLDGKDDSPPFSIGGGGVAAAVWRAVPR